MICGEVLGWPITLVGINVQISRSKDAVEADFFANFCEHLDVVRLLSCT